MCVNEAKTVIPSQTLFQHFFLDARRVRDVFEQYIHMRFEHMKWHYERGRSIFSTKSSILATACVHGTIASNGLNSDPEIIYVRNRLWGSMHVNVRFPRDKRIHDQLHCQKSWRSQNNNYESLDQ